MSADEASFPQLPGARSLVTARYPKLDSLGFLPLKSGPTRVHRLDSAIWGDRVWVKREDEIASLYGGNKVRRFEWLFPRALDRGARTLVTVGGTASTQVTATALFGRHLGFDVTAVLFDQPRTAFACEAIATDLRAGANLVWGGSYLRTAAKVAEIQRTAFRPFLILPGASSALANLGYVDALFEIDAQVARGELPRPDRIVVACGSGGTVAGLAAGAAVLGWPTKITGVRITEPLACNRATLGFLVHSTLRLLGESRALSRSRFDVDGRFLGRGYGFETEEGRAACSEHHRLFGVSGEVTYSGKALAALARIAAENPAETILFVNTLSSRGRRDSCELPRDVPAPFCSLWDSPQA